MHEKGYLHIPGESKLRPDFIQEVEKMLQTLNINIYNTCQKI